MLKPQDSYSIGKIKIKDCLFDAVPSINLSLATYGACHVGELPLKYLQSRRITDRPCCQCLLSKIPSSELPDILNPSTSSPASNSFKLLGPPSHISPQTQSCCLY